MARVGGELTTADGIRAELGTASLVRQDGQVWIYAWQDSVPYPSQSLLVVEFDADGKLLRQEIARAVKPSRGSLEQYADSARYCTVGGTCIEHGVDTDDGTTYDATSSAVTVRGAAKARIRPTEPRADAGAFARIVLPAGDHVVSVRDPVWD